MNPARHPSSGMPRTTNQTARCQSYGAYAVVNYSSYIATFIEAEEHDKFEEIQILSIKERLPYRIIDLLGKPLSLTLIEFVGDRNLQSNHMNFVNMMPGAFVKLLLIGI